MTVTEDAYRMIRRWEGFRPTWKADMVGVETVSRFRNRILFVVNQCV